MDGLDGIGYLKPGVGFSRQDEREMLIMTKAPARRHPEMIQSFGVMWSTVRAVTRATVSRM